MFIGGTAYVGDLFLVTMYIHDINDLYCSFLFQGIVRRSARKVQGIDNSKFAGPSSAPQYVGGIKIVGAAGPSCAPQAVCGSAQTQRRGTKRKTSQEDGENL